MGSLPPVEFLLVVNVDPHVMKLSFDVPYSQITVADVIKKANAFILKSFALLEHKPQVRFLCYIHDPLMGFNRMLYSDKGAIARRLCLTSANAVTQLLEAQACLWYRTRGHHLSSRVLNPESTLEASNISNPVNAAQVQLYALTPDVVNPQQYWPSYQQHQRHLVARQTYIDIMREDLLNRMGENGVDPPSIVSQSAAKFDRVQASDTPISIGFRPSGDFGPLPALFCVPFAWAHNHVARPDLVQLEQVEHGRFITTLWLSHFADDVGAMNIGERQLVDKVHKSLEELIEDPLFPRVVSSDGLGPVCEMDLVAKCRTAHDLEANYLIFEFKKGPFTGGAASLQGFLTYQRLVALAQNSGVVDKTCYPCIIVGVTATDVRVSLAYFSDRVCATELFSASLSRPQNDKFKMEQLARYFQVLRVAARMLRKWYANVHTGASIPNAPFLFPQPEVIIPYHVNAPPPTPNHIDVSSLHLRFVAKFVPSKSSTRCLYHGVMVDEDCDKPTTPVYIKFVTTYGEQPHRLLAALGLAPKLYYCAEVVVGLTMVVMEDLRGSHLPASYGKHYIDIVNLRISEAVSILRDNNFVHGDLRPQNVVIDQKKQAYLIDFDWAGVVGVATYPNRLNPEIAWPRPLADMEGRYIEREDDLFMLQRLLNPTPRKSATPWETSTSKRPRDESEDGEEGRQLSKKSKRESGGAIRGSGITRDTPRSSTRGDMGPPALPGASSDTHH